MVVRNILGTYYWRGTLFYRCLSELQYQKNKSGVRVTPMHFKDDSVEEVDFSKLQQTGSAPGYDKLICSQIEEENTFFQLQHQAQEQVCYLGYDHMMDDVDDFSVHERVIGMRVTSVHNQSQINESSDVLMNIGALFLNTLGFTNSAKKQRIIQLSTLLDKLGSDLARLDHVSPKNLTEIDCFYVTDPYKFSLDRPSSGDKSFQTFLSFFHKIGMHVNQEAFLKHNFHGLSRYIDEFNVEYLNYEESSKPILFYASNYLHELVYKVHLKEGYFPLDVSKEEKSIIIIWCARADEHQFDNKMPNILSQIKSSVNVRPTHSPLPRTLLSTHSPLQLATRCDALPCCASLPHTCSPDAAPGRLLSW